MQRRRSLGWPITLGVVMIVLLVALTVGWVLLTLAAGRTNSGLFWAVLAIGTTFLVLVLLGVVFYLTISIKEISLNQRQANFIDSVTHELKSPIASLKLYLQTLRLRRVDADQQAHFFQVMLEDVERLDALITHLLEAARLDQQPAETEVVDVDLAEVLTTSATTACNRYRLPPETVRLELEGAVVRGRPIDVEIIFRNLIDNAIKYSDQTPEVLVSCQMRGEDTAVIRIIDSGPGIPVNWRRKVFARFTRIGSELERSRSGTGLGLYIVRTLVKRLRGKVTIRGRTNQRGTIFEVELPARAKPRRVPLPSEPATATGS